MGKTIRLTEEQIRRFFGEGFGRRLLGEDIENPEVEEPQEFIAGRAPHQGFLNKTRVNFANTNSKKKSDAESDDEAEASNFKLMAKASMRGLGTTNFDYYTMSSDKIGNGINEVLRIIFDEGRRQEPINILDLLTILHTKLPDKKNPNEYTAAENKILAILDGINIDYLLSGFVGLNAPDYVYHRLKNLTYEEVDRIKKKFGTDFSGWGTICDGCGGKDWVTTVPTAEHDEGYTVFDFAATDTSNAGHFLKENDAGFAGGDTPRKVPFESIMQIHHINGDPGDNSAYNLACLCPNCHASVDSTGRGRETVFSVDSIMNNGNIKSGSLNSRLRADEIERIENDIVDRINNGYFSDRTVANMILNGKDNPFTDVSGKQRDTWVSDVVSAKIDNMTIPGYAKTVVDKNTFKASLANLLGMCVDFARKYRTKDKFNSLLIKNNLSEGKKKDNKVDGVISLSQELKFPFSISYDEKKGGVLLKILRNKQGRFGDKKLLPPSIVIVNELGAVNGDESRKLNIVGEIINICISYANEMLPTLAVNIRDVGQTVASNKQLFVSNENEKAAAAANMAAKSHANQQGNFSQGDLKMMWAFITREKEPAIETYRKKYGPELTEYLMELRKTWVGTASPKTEAEMLSKMKELLGKFYIMKS